MFGVESAPAIWQRSVELVLQDIPMTQCFLDNIIILEEPRAIISTI